ncbi:MAG: hypothetical protein JNM75_10170 [Rhodospirillales bacterium]|nr:hypothetical protein [Rhodospirillales bacterium]
MCPPDPACPYCGGAAATSGSGYDWSFIDGAYCISLQNRADRARNAAAQLHRVGLCRTTLFHRPVKHPTWPVAGIWEAHRAVALHALASGRRTVLILEDDCIFSRHLRVRTVRSIGRALALLPEDWMIFYLGHMSRWAIPVRRNVLRVSSTAAHAYIASPWLLAWLRDRPFGTPGVARVRLSGRGIDSAYARLPGAYALFPMIATQSASPSDHVARPGKSLAIKKPKHLFTRTRYRELILSRAMKPAQYVALASSPVYFGLRYARRKVRRFLRRHSRSAAAT